MHLEEIRLQMRMQGQAHMGGILPYTLRGIVFHNSVIARKHASYLSRLSAIVRHIQSAGVELPNAFAGYGVRCVAKW